MPSLMVVDPTFRRSTPDRHQLADRPATVDGLVVGFREFWPKFDVFTAAFERLLKARHHIGGVERVDGTQPRSGRPLARWEEFTRTVDWAISGLGGCGGCAPWAVFDAIEMEGRGVPTVTLITPDLEGLARRTAESRGYPDLRIVLLPQFLDDLPDEEIDALAAARFEEIMAALTTPLAP